MAFATDNPTIKEVREEIAALQKRGLTLPGAINTVQKALSGKVILLEDGQEVAAGDCDFQAMNQNPQEPAEQPEQNGAAKGLDVEVIKAAVAEAVKGLKAEPAAEVPGRIAAPGAITKANTKVPDWAKRAKVKHFKGAAEIDGKEISAGERAYRFGMWALNLAQQQMPARYEFPNAKAFCEENGLVTKLHVTNSNTLGGYLVPEEFGQDLIDLREQYGVARTLLKVRPMSSDTRTDPRRTSGLTAYFVAEGAAGTESNKGWDQVRLTAKDLMVLSRYTAQLNEDAVLNIGDDLASEISYAFSNKEDDCAFNGTGTSTYGGIVGIRHKLDNVSGTSDSAGLITQGTGNTWAALTLTDFEAVIGVLPQYAAVQGTPVWVASRAFYYNVMKRLELAAGGVTASEIVSNGGMTSFLGFPVRISQVMPTATGTSQVACLFGNFALGASFGDRKQDSIAFSEHATIGGENVFERNEIAIRGVERFDINVHDVGSTSVAGPIVGLKTGS